MDKSVAGLLGAVGALAAVGSAPASAAPVMTPETVLHANSYADLLKPIPNAVALRQAFIDAHASDATALEAEAGRPEVMTVQYYRHHHHHHHRYYQRRYYHHHHHRGVRIGPVVIR